MFKRLASLVLCLVFLTATSLAFAEDVYVTKQGKKYHSSDCRFIKNRETQKIDIEEAKAKGLEPCGRCFGSEGQVIKKQTSENQNEETVYVTKNGKKYHKPDCRLIKNRDTAGIPIAEAESKGITPCSKCFGKQQAKAE